MQPLIRTAVITSTMVLAAGTVCAQSVSFVDPADGAMVSSPFAVQFKVEGMEVKPAGDLSVNTGHHHLLINHDTRAAGEVVLFDDKHVHFGKGQTETAVPPPQVHTKLTMQLPNVAHQSYGAPMGKSIHVTMK